MSQTLEQFQAYQTRLEQYDQAIALLYWDLQTAAPKDSIEAKLSAVGYFSTESFRLSTADEYGSLLKKLSAPDTSVKKVDEKCVVEMFTRTLLESKNQRKNNYRRKMHRMRKRISLRVPRLGCCLLRQSKRTKGTARFR